MLPRPGNMIKAEVEVRGGQRDWTDETAEGLEADQHPIEAALVVSETTVDHEVGEEVVGHLVDLAAAEKEVDRDFDEIAAALPEAVEELGAGHVHAGIAVFLEGDPQNVMVKDEEHDPEIDVAHLPVEGLLLEGHDLLGEDLH